MTQMTQKITKKEAAKQRFLETLRNERFGGKVSLAAKRAGVSRRTLYRYKNADEKFSKNWDEAIFYVKDDLADTAEYELRKAVLRGNIRATIYTLKRLRPEIWGG